MYKRSIHKGFPGSILPDGGGSRGSVGSLRAVPLAPSLGPQSLAGPESRGARQSSTLQGCTAHSAQAGRIITREAADKQDLEGEGRSDGGSSGIGGLCSGPGHRLRGEAEGCECPWCLGESRATSVPGEQRMEDSWLQKLTGSECLHDDSSRLC